MLLAAGVGICWACSAPSAWSQAEEGKEDVLKAQREGSAELVAFYSNIRICATKVTRKSFGDASPVTRQHEFYRADGLLRLEGTGSVVKDGVEVDRTWAWVVNKADKSFRVSRLGEGGKFAIDDLPASDIALQDDVIRVAPYCIAPFGMLDVLVKDLFADDGVEIVKIDKSKDGGGEFVTVHFRRTKMPDEKAATSAVLGWIKFLPARHWAVAEWSFGKNVLERGKVEYNDDDQRIPLIKSYQVWTEVAATGLVYGIEDYLITSISPARLPKTTFQLRSFGLPASAP